MTESTSLPNTDLAQADPAPPVKPAKDKRPAFTFTDDGCRTEVRLGILIMLAAVFLWLWLGPSLSAKVYLLGVPLLAVGIPLQAIQARRQGRPGYPLKMGLVLLVGGALMWPDMLYREEIGGPLGVQPMAPLMLFPGLWIVGWWFYARFGKKEAKGEQGAKGAMGIKA